MDDELKPDKIVVLKDSQGEWRWTRRDGGNHEIVGGSSEGYVNKGACYQNIYDTQGGHYTVEEQ